MVPISLSLKIFSADCFSQKPFRLNSKASQPFVFARLASLPNKPKPLQEIVYNLFGQGGEK
jgi:hypothetical protein